MKRIFIMLLAMLSSAAIATERERVPPPHKPVATSSSTSSGGQASATATSASTSNAVQSNFAPSASELSMYVLPSGALSGGVLPSGMCIDAGYQHRSYLWGLYASADGSSKPDMECMALLQRVENLRSQAHPVAVPVQILTQPAQTPVACIEPAPKTAKAAKLAPKAKACTS